MRNFIFSQVPIIFRGDKVPVGGKLYLDVEKVVMVKSHTRFPHKQMAATLAIVNSDLKVVLWCFIKWERAEVCTYMPSITKLNAHVLSGGIQLELVSLVSLNVLM